MIWVVSVSILGNNFENICQFFYHLNYVTVKEFLIFLFFENNHLCDMFLTRLRSKVNISIFVIFKFPNYCVKIPIYNSEKEYAEKEL